MEIRIGIINSARELAFESNQSAGDIQKIVSTALESDATFFTIADEKGREFIVPVSSLAYVEVGSESSRRVGFVA
ncbi:MAG: DUF3107 domain-containing protein [Cryobacterium sp.]|nr:DUF3107 domain-containing protein [Cryobacterium sp.]